APDGTSALVTKGLLNLTHRDSHERPEPLVPGRVYEVRVPLLAAASRFRPGHRLRLMIACADFQNAWPTPLPHTLTVHHGPARGAAPPPPPAPPRPGGRPGANVAAARPRRAARAALRALGLPAAAARAGAGAGLRRQPRPGPERRDGEHQGPLGHRRQPLQF